MKSDKLTHLYLVAIAIVLLIFAGCSKPKESNLFIMQVDDLIENYPDSALSLLENYDSISYLNRRDKAQYYLALIRARDFDGQQLFLSDSIVNLALNLLNPKKDNIELTAKALLYKGRISSELGEYKEAASYYDKAISILPKEETYYKTLSTAYSY